MNQNQAAADPQVRDLLCAFRSAAYWQNRFQPPSWTDVDAVEAYIVKLERVKRAADAVTARIGCHGEIDSRHLLVLDLLAALKETGDPIPESRAESHG